MERHIYSFRLSDLDMATIHKILRTGYELTGAKFEVTFYGSKGYTSHIAIMAEGRQVERNNTIWFGNMHDASAVNSVLSNPQIDVYYGSDGVRVSYNGPKLD